MDFTVRPLYIEGLRGIYAIAIALCLVVAGARPSEVHIRDQRSSQLTIAPPLLASASLTRRSHVPDAQLRLLYVSPASRLAASWSPHVLFLDGSFDPRSPARTYVASRSSRGPPHDRS